MRNAHLMRSIVLGSYTNVSHPRPQSHTAGRNLLEFPQEIAVTTNLGGINLGFGGGFENAFRILMQQHTFQRPRQITPKPINHTYTTSHLLNHCCYTHKDAQSNSVRSSRPSLKPKVQIETPNWPSSGYLWNRLATSSHSRGL